MSENPPFNSIKTGNNESESELLAAKILCLCKSIEIRLLFLNKSIRSQATSSKNLTPIESPDCTPEIENAIDVNQEENDNEQNKGELNYFAPKNSLQQLLRKEWFTKVRSDKKYDTAWTDAFVEALMGSEYGEGIARDWAWNIGGERNRHIQIKGYVVGLLVDAGVLKGSKRTIAKRIVEDQNDREMDEEDFGKKIGTLSRKMYTDTAGKQPYAQWVKGYVKENS